MAHHTVLQDGSQRVPVFAWTDLIDDGALRQLRNAARLPFVFHHVAAMPDVHLGIGATVGSVIATQEAISPAAVGVDIGCGMVAQRIDLRTGDLDASLLGRLRARIEGAVPVGHRQHELASERASEFIAATWDGFPSVLPESHSVKAACQLGTLGGGNHFIELCLDGTGSAWVLLHSGSRNVGKVVADRHIDQAKGLMRRYFIDLPDPDLAYFVEGTSEFSAYMHDLEWCQAYALRNRELMMEIVLGEIARVLGRGGDGTGLQAGDRVNCHHNYVARESHFGVNVLVTRKGAIRARKGELGIIPGSMGTSSFIVRGLGNPDSFESAPHGAGRRMSRAEARRRFSESDVAAQTAGVECRKDRGVVDEVPGAYKEIGDVIRRSADLVEVVAELRQVLCVKG
jgi:tRNA-splicing ligase RtcB